MSEEENAANTLKVGGENAREQAYLLLAENVRPVSIAKKLGVKAATVSAWRDSPEGQKRLGQIRKDRAREFEQAASRAHEALRELALPAVAALRERLASKVPFEAVTAAREILSRIGVSASVVIEGKRRDLSKLTDEQIKLLAELEAIAGGE